MKPARPSRPDPPAGSTAEEIEEGLRGRLLTPFHDSGVRVSDRGWVVWLVTGLVTGFAALWRLVGLGRPSRLVFDETYYVKQAYSLLHLGYEGRWAEGSDINFAAGVFTDLSSTADYVVHPGLGKWMIAAGMAFFDPADPVGWRISAAVAGTLSVALLVLIGRRLFGHIVYGGMAGLFLAVDGIHLVMSRISVLDVFLSFWVLAGFAALLLDRDSYRARLARRSAVGLHAHGTFSDGWGVRTGIRWWLVVAGVCLGLATGVKWSGVFFLAVFGLVAVAWSITARREAGVPLWFGAGVIRDGVPAFLLLVPAAVAAYLATWIPWFLSPNAYLRAEATNAFTALWRYHLSVWEFHTRLTSEHTYMSDPLGWLLQTRPTSFAWQQIHGPAAEELCGAETCAASILAVGNPIVWWGGAIGLGVVLWGAFRRGDWRAWAILAGYLGGYVPWFVYPDRTVFTFYTVAFAPFVALALTYAISRAMRPPTRGGGPPRSGVALAIVILIGALGFGAYFWPIWTAQWVPHWFWQAHMFFPSWI